MVKSPRGRRRSPSKSPSRSPSRRSASPPRAGLQAPELLYSPGVSQPRRPMVEPGWKPTVPTLYVTEPGAHMPAVPRDTGPPPKWVEVEETIEVQVKKTGSRGVSPAREVPGSSAGLLFILPGGTPKGDPNTNNSNNKLLAQEPTAQGRAVGSIGERIFHMDAEAEPPELSPLEPAKEGPLEVHLMEEPFSAQDLWDRDPKILKQHGRVLTLADLEDYVPQEGETFGCGSPMPSAANDAPCEVSVLQREISEPTVGQPILLNMGCPPAPQSPPGFFSCLPKEVAWSGPQVLNPSVSSCVREARAGGTASWKPSFCTRVQRSSESGQSSFKTEVSTQTVSFGTVGEPVTLRIRTDEDDCSSPSQG